MRIDTAALTNQLRERADTAALASANYRATGNNSDADFHSGRHAGFLAAMGLLADAVTAAYAERDAALAADLSATWTGTQDEYERAVRGASVDLGAVQDLEEFARHAGGAVDMASGTVYSDAEGGL